MRDGNRRVAALKLLNSPTLCENASIRPLIDRIASANRERIISAVDCIGSANEDFIVEYISRKHTGENEGIGQKNWTALLTSLFNYHRGATDQNKRAVQLVLWVETRGLPIDDDFPITTLTRMLGVDSLKMIGFKVEADELVSTLPENQTYTLAARLIQDIARKVINVSRDPDDAASVYTSTAQDAYFARIRRELGPPLESDGSAGGNGGNVNSPPSGDDGAASPDQGSAHPGSGAGGGQQGSGGSGTGSGGTGGVRGGGATGGGHTPTSAPSWDRTCIFPKRRPKFTLPADQTKAGNVIVELKKLNVKDTPQAVAMLFRTLVELSEKYYRERNGLREADAFHKRIACAADHMKDTGRLNEEQHDAIIRRTREDSSLLHVKTLHAYVHSEHFHPSFQVLNSMWDEIGCFVAACWKQTNA